MKDSMTKAAVSTEVCSRCGRTGCNGPVNVEIAIMKGHVRRASSAADEVYEAATGQQGLEMGVVLMTAILLIERLSTAHNCDPRNIISKINSCFDLKESYQRAPKHCN